MEKGQNKSSFLKLKDAVRRAKIFEDCHKIFEDIAQKTLRPDVFPDFKFTFENIGNDATSAEATHLKFSSRNFRFPNCPVEQKRLLDSEAELERTDKAKERIQRPLAEQPFGRYEGKALHVQFDRILCSGSRNAGVRPVTVLYNIKKS